MRAIGVSHTACKDEFRRTLRSHSWSVFLFFIIYRFFQEDHFFSPMTPGFNQRKPGLKADSLSTRPQSHIAIFFFLTNKYIFFMRNHFFFDDTRIRTSEGHQDYKRTVYVLDHNMSQQQWCIYQYYFFTNKYQFFHKDNFFLMRPLDSTNENQAYKRAVYQLEDHKVTYIDIYLLSLL